MKTIGMPDDVARGLYRILGLALDNTQDIDYDNGIVTELCIRCPNCKRKVQPIYKDTTAQNFPIKCKHCKTIFKVNI